MDTSRFCDRCEGRIEHRAFCPNVSGANYQPVNPITGEDRYYECEGCGKTWPDPLLDDYGYCGDCRQRHVAELAAAVERGEPPF